MVKVWSASPGPPQTYATYVSPSGVTALDWVPHSDQKFIYGTMNGMVRICDKDERKSSTEFHLQEGQNPFINHLTCSSTGNLCAIGTSFQTILPLFLTFVLIYFHNFALLCAPLQSIFIILRSFAIFISTLLNR